MSRFDNLEIIDDEGRHRVPDPALLALCEKIFDCYVEERPTYCPGRVTVPKKHYIKFYKAAELCQEQGLTAPQFVKQQLEGMARTGNFWPSAIANPGYADRAGGQDIVAQIALRYYKSQLICYSRWASIYGPRGVLSDPSFQLTALIRFIKAHELGLDDLTEKYRDAARREMASSPIACELFSDYKGLLRL